MQNNSNTQKPCQMCLLRQLHANRAKSIESHQIETEHIISAVRFIFNSLWPSTSPAPVPHQSRTSSAPVPAPAGQKSTKNSPFSALNSRNFALPHQSRTSPAPVPHQVGFGKMFMVLIPFWWFLECVQDLQRSWWFWRGLGGVLALFWWLWKAPMVHWKLFCSCF